MAADSVAASVFVAAPPERVYEYFTQPAAIVRWMGEYALLEPEPNGQFALDIRGTPVRGHYLELEPPHRLLISWGYAGSERVPPDATTLEVRLIPERNGTRVELEHRDLPADEKANHVSGWTHYLARLTTAATQTVSPTIASPCSRSTSTLSPWSAADLVVDVNEAVVRGSGDARTGPPSIE
jgi:uncharacterized protein YndB with AHSA1/START domain